MTETEISQKKKKDAFEAFEKQYSAVPEKAEETAHIKPLDVPPVRENIVLRPKSTGHYYSYRKISKWTLLEKRLSGLFGRKDK